MSASLINCAPLEILLVEDNDDDANLALRAFEKANLSNRVYRVRDGEEALQFLFGAGPYAGRAPSQGKEIVLLDLELPRLSGMEVLRRIKSDQRTQAMKIIILTGTLAGDRGVMESYKMGALACIMKPISFAKFAEAVCEIGLPWVVCSPEEVQALATKPPPPEALS